ncbi:hypothetical protein DFP72DRAFT_856451 [Ephemerocybe angulata]|uniref:F-box domain-containing protein n=1 Tax=Ephemerocybe angulata TaxID=980116 RepID=A0A8H6LY82_9AGAR|nr:hypothetical protein DFP72DRAFT_856451 [Tulosesus angulatus]
MAHINALDRLFLCNKAPGPQESFELNEAIASLTHQIDDRNEEIKQLEHKRSCYRAVCSPIRRIPAEVLGLIFELSLSMPLDHLGRRDLVAISLTCQAWRSAALEARSLWSGVTLESCKCFDYGFAEITYMHDEEYEKVLAWFQRSGGAPKTLEYRLSQSSCRCFAGSRCTISNPTVERLIREGPSLDRFLLQVSSVGCLRKWPILTRTPSTSAVALPGWSALRSFSIIFCDSDDHLWDDEDGKKSIFNLFPDCSSFELSLPRRAFAFDEEVDSLTEGINIPDRVLASIKTFSIVWDWDGDQLSRILPRCTSLTRLSVDLTKRSNPFGRRQTLIPPYTSAQSSITLPKLREFVLSNGDFAILDLIRAPALEILDLEVNAASEGSQDDIEKLRRFMRTSSLTMSLRNLTIRGLVGNAGVVDLSLPVLGSLKILVLDSPHVSSYHLGEPVVTSVDGQWCFRHPSLVDLRLMNLCRSEDTLVSELDFLANRRLSDVPCVISVKFHDAPRFSQAELTARATHAKSGCLFVSLYPSSVS